MTDARDIALLRLVAQRLAGPRAAGAAEAVRELTAMQGQDHLGVVTSVALRTENPTRDAVEAAFDGGAVVKSWPMRGTLHLLAAEDLGWMLELLTPRIVAGAVRRSEQLGLDVDSLQKAREVALGVLAGGRALRRAELMAAWEEAGLPTTGQRGYHMLWQAAQAGAVCFGPTRDGEQLLVRCDEWIREPRRLERDEALGELALRYFRSHGPATVPDLARWAGLPLRDARTGTSLARAQLATLQVGRVEHYLDPDTPERLAAARKDARRVLLLPSFDEMVLGYADRTATVPAEFADHLVPGGNGVFRATVLCDGRAVGTWKAEGRGPRRRLTLTPFAELPPRVIAGAEKAFARLP